MRLHIVNDQCWSGWFEAQQSVRGPNFRQAQLCVTGLTSQRQSQPRAFTLYGFYMINTCFNRVFKISILLLEDRTCQQRTCVTGVTRRPQTIVRAVIWHFNSFNCTLECFTLSCTRFRNGSKSKLWVGSRLFGLKAPATLYI